jgi:segregation and condensation protein B
MSLKAKVEAVIYAAEEPVTLKELAALLKDAVLAELRAEEEARLALNVVIADGHPGFQPQDDEEDFQIEEGDESAEQASAEEISATFSTDKTPSDEATANTQPERTEAAISKEEERRAEEKEQLAAVKARLSALLDELIADYAADDHGVEIRHIAGGYRLATKPEHHDVVVSFAKSLKPPIRLSLQALETLSVIAYKQPVTVPEISEIRGVDSAGVIATLLDRKLITTAGRKQVIGRPILYKTTKEFLLRFGLNDVSELPSMEEFEKLGDPGAPVAAGVGAMELEPGAADGAAGLEPQTELFGGLAATVPTESQPSEDEEPVTEAVPDPAHRLRGETTMPKGGTYATEAEPQNSSEKS